MNDISKYFTTPSLYEQTVGRGMIAREGTPEAITYFAAHSERLGDYLYWFYLSTLWVSYTGHSDLELWKELFASGRRKRKHSIMKPSEVKRFDMLPYDVTVYRAHRPGETDWIAYTLSESVVKRFAAERGVTHYRKYQVHKKHILALFTRRGEEEIIVLDNSNVRFSEEIKIKESE